MSGHTMIHPGPGASVKAHVLNAQIASLKARRMGERRETIATFLFEGRRRVWMTEEAAQQGRRRSLIDDNPTSG